MSGVATAVVAGSALTAGAGYLASQSAADASKDAANSSRQLSEQQYSRAQEAAGRVPEFRPVTVTSSFGTPQYTYDSSGRLTGVSSTPAPWLANLQKQGQDYVGQYMGLQGAALQDKRLFDYATQAYGAGQNVYNLAGQTAEQAQGLYGVGQEMYGLGRGLLPTAQQYNTTGQTLQQVGSDIFGKAAQAMPESYDTTQATQDYYTQMKNLVAADQERQLAATRNSVFQKGRQGLSVGATQAGGELATNPEMAAYYNALAKSDASLALDAKTRAINDLAARQTMGLGLYGAGLQQYQTGLNYGQAGTSTTQTASNILGQGTAATQSGIGANTSAANLYNTGTGLFGSGAGLQNQYYTNLVASQAPFTGQMSQLSALESMYNQPVALGMQYGGLTTTQANAIADAYIRASGAGGAAAQQAIGYDLQANSQNPWASLIGGAGSGLQSWGASQQRSADLKTLFGK
jgi:YD repeat-containing protein